MLSPRLESVFFGLGLGALGLEEHELERDAFLRAAEAMLARQPQRERRQLAMLFRALDWVPVLCLRGARASGLPPARAAQFFAGLLRWLSRSRLGSLRRVAGALRTLTAFAAYGLQSSWQEIGYDGPWVGVHAIARLPDPELGQ